MITNVFNDLGFAAEKGDFFFLGRKHRFRRHLYMKNTNSTGLQLDLHIYVYMVSNQNFQADIYCPIDNDKDFYLYEEQHRYMAPENLIEWINEIIIEINRVWKTEFNTLSLNS